MRQLLNWRTYLVLAALAIVAASLLYTSRLAAHLASEERKKVDLLAQGIKTIATSKNDEEISFATTIITQDSSIPRIITDASGAIQSIQAVDTGGVRDMDLFMKKKILEYKQEHPPILVDYDFGQVYIYYGESLTLSRLRYFPYAQMAIISLFLLVVIIAISAANRSIQNQVWAGLSKETAHQLGTPISSIEGWMELVREELPDNDYVKEMQKDVDRLKLVADRFGKVGSAPQLQEENLADRLQEMVQYMQKRAPSKVSITLECSSGDIPVLISGPLFDWVIENLIRNALDAMEGQGSIQVLVEDRNNKVVIDVIDNGKGIPKHQIKKVFTPGFTTKKRGWGLGLSLAKRIIERYHYGALFVKQSELKKGTTFRIILNR